MLLGRIEAPIEKENWFAVDRASVTYIRLAQDAECFWRHASSAFASTVGADAPLAALFGSESILNSGNIL